MRVIFGITAAGFLLAGCAQEDPLLLENAEVTLEDEAEEVGAIGIMSGENEGDIVVPIALRYAFTLHNTDGDTLGALEAREDPTVPGEEELQVRIEPKEALDESVNAILEGNIFAFDEAGWQTEGFGTGYMGAPVLEGNAQEEYVLDFVLGAEEENPEIPTAPSAEELEELLAQAHEAEIVVTLGGEEIERFDVSGEVEE